MKIVSAVAKVLAALAAAVGAIYLLATYGEQIVAWCKKAMAKLPAVECNAEVTVTPNEEEAAPEITVEEVAVEEVPVEEVPVEEPAAENEVVADEADFAE